MTSLTNSKDKKNKKKTENTQKINPIFVFDFTLKAECIQSKDNLITLFIGICKQWVFQLEQGESTGYKHYQGRITLKERMRKHNLYEKLNIPEIQLSPTSNANYKNDYYVTKEDTRIARPWSDKDNTNIIEIPWDIAEINELLPWQNTLMEISKKRELRKINVILDIRGNIGKTTFTRYMMWNKLARIIPFCNDYKDILRMVMDMPESPTYIIDMPRAINKEKLHSLYSAIETVKGGYAFDDRYNFRDKLFNPPNIFVFSNCLPDSEMLTKDRWILWDVCPKTNKLIKYIEKPPYDITLLDR